jgi:AAA15 family ATPase/GTPase
MLIRFQVSNFLSFHQEIEFSMISGKTRSLPHHVVKGENRYDLNILRSAAIYGPNASGKTNLIKAMDFARNLILAGTKAQEAIPRRPFKLARSAPEEPSKFAFEFKHGDRSFNYGFELDARRIQSEWLYEIKRTTETMLFERTTTKAGKTKVEFGRISTANNEERDFLQFVARGTRPNQLFLTECIERNVEHFDDAYRWFSERLLIIFPTTQYLMLGELGKKRKLSDRIVQILEGFGIGISGFELIEANPDLEFSEAFNAEMRKVIGKDPVTIAVARSDGERFIVQVSPEAEIKAQKLVLKHRMVDGGETPFEMSEESDGTRRLLDLVPVLTISQHNKVVVIDELDRSLHPSLSREFIRAFLDPESTSQLIVTTHDSTLLDFDLLRRDEIWFVEKDSAGASNVYSLEEFTPRFDKDIEKGYLLGRFGAVPIIKERALP